uniref:Pectate lyase superfamily protein domain-containing protein n=1 Tax=Oryza brachyantha TaxID=4533 RepID=J3KWV0_ORYBR
MIRENLPLPQKDELLAHSRKEKKRGEFLAQSTNSTVNLLEISINGRIIAVNDTSHPQLFNSTWIVSKYTFVFLLVLALRSVRSEALKRPSHNVLDFNAAGDGKSDDTQAFLAAWEQTCNDDGWPILIIPGGRTFLLKQVTFSGSCKSPIMIQVDGNIVAPNYIWTSEQDNLITFYSVDNLTLEGNGQIDGKGAIWWTCYTQKLLAFAQCNNLSVRNIHLTNSPIKHMILFRCSQVHVYNVSINAPGDSPNTDGITMAISDHVYISNCSIQSGDDCVSMLSHTTDVNITDTRCGPGHGISVGSLGQNEKALVERIVVSHCSFFGTMNGVRIKSWQGGKGQATGFIFENLNMTAVQNPIVIDQFYCPQGNCPVKDGGVAITDARFINIHGTSSEKEAIKILCSQSVHCQGIYLSNINLSWENHTAPANATILNAQGTIEGWVVPKVDFSKP